MTDAWPLYPRHAASLSRTVVVTPPSAEPLTLAEAKLHLRVDIGDDDALITRGIAAARASVEAAVRRALMPQSLRSEWTGFPADDGPIVLPRAPVTAVNQVAYSDPDGNDQTLDPSAYRVVMGGDGPAEIVPVAGTCWPWTACYPDAVRVTYDAGYAEAASVPDCAKAAILLRLGTLYEQRERALVVGNVVELDETERWILAPIDWGGYP